MSDTGRRPRLLQWSLLTGTALLLLGGFLLEASAPEADQIPALGEDAALREVSVLRASFRSATRSEVAGVLEPRRSVQLFSETSGRVVALGAEALDRVEAGRSWSGGPAAGGGGRRARRAAVTRVAASRRWRSRTSIAAALWRRGVASNAALDDAENSEAVAAASLREAQRELTRAHDDLTKKVIRAPFDGILRSFDVEAGEYVRVGQQLGELLDGSTARITIGLSDRDVVGRRAGPVGARQAGGLSGRELRGQVLRVGRASDRQHEEVSGRGGASQQSGRLLPGMVGTVALELGTAEPRILVPRDATLDEFGVRSVYVIEPASDGRRLRRPPAPGRSAPRSVPAGRVRGRRRARRPAS